MSEEPQIQNHLPENAYRELKPGEKYVPMVPPNVTAPELTMRSIIFGIVMNILFAMAATYLALKVGQGIETAIPISILAVGLSGFLLRFGLRRSTIIENINVLAISTTSGMVAGGTVFTMPAIYLLGLPDALKLSSGMIFLHIFLVPFFGAIFGVIFLVPFRRYFVKEMHGKLPFPEGTATNEILVTGQSGGRNAFILVYSFLIAGIYAFCTSAMRLWTEVFTTGNLDIIWKAKAPAGAVDAAGQAAKWVDRSAEALALPGGPENWWYILTTKFKAVVAMGTGAEFLGLGFIIGVRYASIIMAGSLLSFLVIVPLLSQLDVAALQSINPAISGESAGAIFNGIPKNIGIGCIFTAGLLSILKMSKVIVTALREALGSLFRKRTGPLTVDRTDEDISYPVLGLLGVLAVVGVGVYFYTFVFHGMEQAMSLTLWSVVLAVGVSFIFITVSAWAIATISVTPISGMTVTTIIVTAVALMAAGLSKGPQGQLAVLLVGGVVASALSVAGTLVTEFKLGYWTGASPKKIQWSCLIGCLLASVVVTATIMLLAKTMGFDPEVNPGKALQAPQANLMKSALQSFLGTGQVPWIPYAVGVVFALLLQLVGVSPLAFGLGMYLPMYLNFPILIGAWVAALVKWGARSEAIAKVRTDKGIIIASGFIAGAAIMGVVLSALRAVPALDDFFASIDVQGRMIRAAANPEEAAVGIAQQFNWLGIVAFGALCAFILWDARRAKPAAPLAMQTAASPQER